MLLRIYNVDKEIDTNVSKKALTYFNEAQTEFSNKNYNQAAILYRRACEEQPDFYKARMYLGDCYYFSKNYTDAVNVFTEVRDKFPFLLEPHKYLIDAYAKKYAYDKCVDESIAAMCIYPDFSVMQKMEDAAYMDHKNVNINWIPRGILPNKPLRETSELRLNDYSDKDTIVAAPWLIYKEAGEKISQFCDSNGIVKKPNNLTQSKYMEVFSWEYMLENSVDSSLDDARKMKAMGYLDCYVLVSLFHYDLYPQYASFIADNKEKVARYYKEFIKNRN
jgi:tetratricopeptide (TPR) repeat protein